jgi:hypothetical protein
MVHQMRGEWRIKNPTLRTLHGEAQSKAARFREVQYEHHPRSHSEITTVDRALNRLLDLEAQGSSPRAAV